MKITYNNINYEISGVAINSAQVKPGFAFFCIVGAKADGHNYAEDAVARGASVIFCERKLRFKTDEICNVEQIVVDDTHKAAAEIACQFYGHPSSALKVVGITGTNGKTTTCNIVAHVMQSVGKKTAVIGTTGIFIDGRVATAEKIGVEFVGRTTPDCISIQKLFASFVKLDVDVVVMEVSSHALDQKRVWGIDFDVCAFTNLTQDHLDYHKTIDNYFEAKALLFGTDYPGSKVICIDDKWGEKLVKIANSSTINGQNAEVVTCGLNNSADVSAPNFECDFPLIGKFNKQNMLVAAAICNCLGVTADDIKHALATTPQVDGRIQVVSLTDINIYSEKKNIDSENLATVVVDYAHTPDALQNAATTLAEVAKEKSGKLIVVFGCGGDRDKTKRPQMGKVATSIADYTIITTDNPRTENPEVIISDIKTGLDNDAKYEAITDRKDAIGKALKIAHLNDVVLIAGKGHEDYQEINGVKHHFDDRKIAAEFLTKLAKTL